MIHPTRQCERGERTGEPHALRAGERNAPCDGGRGRGQTPPSCWHHRKRGLTLVELLVVIVILVTLVAGVIPMISPNNDTRKIREASRGLQAYINSAQAEAARTGRPHGIGFVERSLGIPAANSFRSPDLLSEHVWRKVWGDGG